jgi:hypothetical protein
LAYLAGLESAETTEPVETTVGGIPALAIDVELAEGSTNNACGPPCVRLFNLPAQAGQFWAVMEGYRDRIWLVDVDGTTVAFVADATDNLFEDWVAQVELSIAGLTWG